MNSLTIYKVYHNQIVEDLYPFENDGIRIKYNTEKNPQGIYINEFCVWLDDTINPTTDFVGIEHYRRVFQDITPETKDSYLNKIPEDGCIIFERYYDIDQTCYLDCIGLSKYKNQLSQYFLQNNLLQENELLCNTKLHIWRGMFIMMLEQFQQFRQFIKDIVNFLLTENNLNTKEDFDREASTIIGAFGQPHRFMAYILENIVDIWLRIHLPNAMPTFIYDTQKETL